MFKTVLLTAAGVALMSGAAHAQTNDDNKGFYGNLGYSSFALGDSTDGDLDFDGPDFDAATLRGGYEFNEFFALEAEGSIGLSDDSIGNFDFENEDGNPVTGQADADLNHQVGAFAKASYPVTPTFDVFARAGVVDASIDIDAAVDQQGESVPGIEDGGDLGFAAGGGAEWMFAGKNGVRAEYTRYEFDNGDADSATISYVRKF